MCLYLTNYRKIYNKAVIYVKELILPPVYLISNAQNFMQKTYGNIFLGYPGGRVFHILPRLPSIMRCVCVCVCGGVAPNTFRIFVNHVTIFNSSPLHHLRWSSLQQKIINNWKLLLTVLHRALH